MDVTHSFKLRLGEENALAPDSSKGLSYGLPYIGSAVIDIDGDNKFEVFIGGGTKRKDILLRYQNGQMVNVIEGTNLNDTSSASYGVTAIDFDFDFDFDGDTDLFVGRENSTVTYYKNNGKGVFSAIKLNIKIPEDSAPMSISIGDVDNDGDGDLYLSMFGDAGSLLGNASSELSIERRRSNMLLCNEGNLNFTDKTTTKLAGKCSTYNSVFADLNNDFKPDLIVSDNFGKYQIFENSVDFSFKRVAMGVKSGFWMGIAVGDMDNDGDTDVFSLTLVDV